MQGCFHPYAQTQVSASLQALNLPVSLRQFSVAGVPLSSRKAGQPPFWKNCAGRRGHHLGNNAEILVLSKSSFITSAREVFENPGERAGLEPGPTA